MSLLLTSLEDLAAPVVEVSRAALAPLHAPARAVLSGLGYVPLSVQVAGHCVFMAALFRPKYRPYWLANVVMSFIGGFGGGLIAQYTWANAPMSLFGNLMLSIHVLCWWAVNHCPADAVMRLYDAFLPLRAFCQACTQVLRVGLITKNVDVARAKFPGTVWGAVFTGAISGCGGRYLADLAQAVLFPATERSPPELLHPSASTISAVVIAALHLALVHGLGALPSDVSDGFLKALFTTDTLCSVLFGPYDWTGPLHRAFLFCLNVPPARAPKKMKKK